MRVEKYLIVALLIIGGISFAFFGNGLFQQNETIVQKHIEFMKAMHSGDYQAAKEIANEYKIGPRWMWDDELYNLHLQLQQAYLNKDIEKVQQLKQEIFKLKTKNNENFLNGKKRWFRGLEGFRDCPMLNQS
ncbi:MAG: hypothetical protein ACK4J0_03840 [Candidatus Anstonellaceae archaeon]